MSRSDFDSLNLNVEEEQELFNQESFEFIKKRF